MCRWRHKIIEVPFTQPAEMLGSEIVAGSIGNEQYISVQMPKDESLSIKSDLITVKYYVRVVLDIPHSFDLHLTLPLVVTSSEALKDHLSER